MKRLIAPIAGVITGVVATSLWFGLKSPDAPQVVCRPSAPEVLSLTPDVLFWGNSLAFDGNWDQADRVAVNCARQGLTAEAATTLVDDLPLLDLKVVALVFGTVEMLRGQTDAVAFRAAIESNLSSLRTRYPAAQFVVIGIPEGAPWIYDDDATTAAYNHVLKDMAGTIFISATEALSQVPAQALTYDGVHLTQQSYAVLREALWSVVGDILQSL